jgi:SH3-like domain-containing protein
MAAGLAAAAAVVVTGPVTTTGALTATGGVTATAPVTASTAPTATAAKPRLTIEQDLINVRTGPGTNYNTAGSAARGEAFDIVGKSAAGDWWLVCCVGGETVWVFGQLGRAENAESVPVATPAALAAAPQPAAAQPVATQAPAAPAPEPAATEAPAPAPPAEGDPCAGIGGDGCKFKVKAGPAFAPNGGSELKLTLGFIHSGVEGGQPQGSYFVVLLKDGQNLNIPDSVRSFDPSVGMRDGPNGKYNYEYKLGLDGLPGGTVAGNYTIWVLDGNGERDSQNVNFTVPDGQGEVYILFDQA